MRLTSTSSSVSRFQFGEFKLSVSRCDTWFLLYHALDSLFYLPVLRSDIIRSFPVFLSFSCRVATLPVFFFFIYISVPWVLVFTFTCLCYVATLPIHFHFHTPHSYFQLTFTCRCNCFFLCPFLTIWFSLVTANFCLCACVTIRFLHFIYIFHSLGTESAPVYSPTSCTLQLHPFICWIFMHVTTNQSVTLLQTQGWLWFGPLTSTSPGQMCRI